ncbi:hypothetical protein ES708_29916 [subsurface metagenome]
MKPKQILAVVLLVFVVASLAYKVALSVSYQLPYSLQVFPSYFPVVYSLGDNHGFRDKFVILNKMTVSRPIHVDCLPNNIV